MTTRKYFDQNVIIQIECLDCGSSEQRNFRIGDTFNLEGDCILKESDELYFCQTSCSGCENFMFIDLRWPFPTKTIRDFYNGFKALEKEQT